MGLFRSDRGRDQLAFDASTGRVGRLSRAERHLVADAFARDEGWAVRLVDQLAINGEAWAENLSLHAIGDDLRAQGIDPNRPSGFSAGQVDDGAVSVTYALDGDAAKALGQFCAQDTGEAWTLPMHDYYALCHVVSQMFDPSATELSDGVITAADAGVAGWAWRLVEQRYVPELHQRFVADRVAEWSDQSDVPADNPGALTAQMLSGFFYLNDPPLAQALGDIGTPPQLVRRAAAHSAAPMVGLTDLDSELFYEIFVRGSVCCAISQAVNRTRAHTGYQLGVIRLDPSRVCVLPIASAGC